MALGFASGEQLLLQRSFFCSAARCGEASAAAAQLLQLPFVVCVFRPPAQSSPPSAGALQLQLCPQRIGIAHFSRSLHLRHCRSCGKVRILQLCWKYA